jgi:hypothetical protein
MYGLFTALRPGSPERLLMYWQAEAGAWEAQVACAAQGGRGGGGGVCMHLIQGQGRTPTLTMQEGSRGQFSQNPFLGI